ncbi:p25-alpha domain containing protein [Asbolus verrucosus]|uniref:p25-alpha domain containing protein n=1 Tax=Asbolus verrucosus TaxID=1661398 RepID=A0A482VGI6_ASBVE|nr:p25-alpha domain containing protein [Asbolus verrucosus]
MAGGGSLEHQFEVFAKLENAASEGKKITLEQIDKWFEEAKLMGKKINSKDTEKCFNKFKSKAKDIDCATFMKFLNDLAKEKNIPPDELKQKLANCEAHIDRIVEVLNEGAQKVTGVIEAITEDAKKTP